MTKKIVWCSYDESWVVTDAYFCWRSEHIPGDLDELWYHPFEHRKMVIKISLSYKLLKFG